MPKTTITVSSDTLVRVDWYRDTFSMTSDELLNHLMDKLSLASADAIRLHKKNFRPTEIKAEAE